MMYAPMQAGEHNIFLPPAYDILWSVVCLVIIGVVLYYFALPKFYAVLDKRENTIKEGLAATQKAEEAQALAERRLDETLAKAHKEAGEIRTKANEEAKAILDKAREDARAEVTRIVDNGQRQVEADRQAAEISLRTDLGLLATELAEKIVGEHLKNTELSARVVDRFLDDLERESVTEGR
ncbi:F0F1 ATP synthase subunit B [Gleimia hominis]|nr:F0F1 ATP synthase subunit B [Gleimia hominis]